MPSRPTSLGHQVQAEFFDVDNNVITIKYSDGNGKSPADQGQEQLGSGAYTQLNPNNPRYKRYLTKVGWVVAKWVLPTYIPGFALKTEGKPHDGEPIWRLAALPEGYTLWLRTRQSNSGQREDVYLWGSKTCLYFSSPMEFAPHAIWLAGGGSGRCICCYHTGSRLSQIPITHHLIHDMPGTPWHMPAQDLDASGLSMPAQDVFITPMGQGISAAGEQDALNVAVRQRTARVGHGEVSELDLLICSKFIYSPSQADPEDENSAGDVKEEASPTRIYDPYLQHGRASRMIRKTMMQRKG
ncbi:hypothetical protein FA95DRAFT_440753 [Auriscalpium vulgare]|uniref:Uncharacterized protein n=1 Tax=Auriscalpium vulgare TaxID=40419 RepID=A0ACB8RHL4_9AGAM|nr:hypothetical protein FA95DRAFT_440753 [Auriscalpium vulgare]